MNKVPRIAPLHSQPDVTLLSGTTFAGLVLLLMFAIHSPLTSAEVKNSVWGAGDWLHSIKRDDSYRSICSELVERPLSFCLRNLPAHNPQIKSADALPLGSQLQIPLSWLKAPPVPAVVELVKGDAFFERRLPDQFDEDSKLVRSFGPREALKAGAQLATGDRIVTEAGYVLLRFADESSFLMKQNSELELERMTAHGTTGMVDTHMRLNRGSGRARVNSRDGKTRYRISTPVAIAAARGTDFSISAEPPEGESGVVMRNEVLEGLVSVTRNNQGGPLLPPGFGTFAKAGEAISDPIELLPASRVAAPKESEFPFTLQWSDVADAEGYAVEIFEGLEGASGGLVSSQRVEQSEVDVKNLDAGDYSFVVRAIDKHGLRGLEAGASTSAEVELPAPEWQRSKIQVEGSEIELAWSPIRYADSYQLQISNDADFNNIVHDSNTEQSSATVTLPEGAKYYARVRAEYSHYGSGQFGKVHALNEEGPRSWWLILLGVLAVAV